MSDKMADLIIDKIFSKGIESNGESIFQDNPDSRKLLRTIIQNMVGIV